jgi:hypothetical protein
MRFLKSRATFSRCSCFGDNFLCRLTGLKLDLPSGLAARRERSKFNKNQKTRFDSNFFILSFLPSFSRLEISFAARFVQSVFARLMPNAKTIGFLPKNADEIEKLRGK